MYTGVERGVSTAGVDIVFLLWAIRTLAVLIAVELLLVYYGRRWPILWVVAAVLTVLMFAAALQVIRERRRDAEETEDEMWPRARPILIWIFRAGFRATVFLIAGYFTLYNISPRLAHDARFEVLAQANEWHENIAELLRFNRPPIPFVDDYPCPFECCNYDEWRVVRETPVRAYPDASAIITSVIVVGDVVDARDSVVITRMAGAARILRRTTLGGVSLAQGETIYLLRPTLEGRELFWHAGRTYDAQIAPPTGAAVEVLRQPKYQWWVEVKPKDAPAGWALHEGQLVRTKPCS